MMRFLVSLSSFAITMLLGLIAFAYTALNHPTTMRELFAVADKIRGHFSVLGLSDNYLVWVDILLQSNQIVLVGFTIFIRLVIAVIEGLFGGGRDGSRNRGKEATSPQDQDSLFRRWG